MGDVLPVTFRTLARGIDTGAAPHEVPEGFVPSAINMYNSDKNVRGRNGAKALTSLYGNDRPDFNQDAPPLITGLHAWTRRTPLYTPMRPAGGLEWDLFAGTTDSIARWNRATDVWTELTPGGLSGANRYPWLDEPWHFIQYNQIMYAFRIDTGMRRVSRFPLMDLSPGIPVPTQAVTLSAGSVGTTPGASYSVVVVFRNPLTGQRGNPSAVSNTFAAGGATKVLASGIPISTNLQVGQRELYVTLPNQGGQWLLWAVINDNVTTTYEADIDVNLLGPAVSFRNTIPPSGLRFGKVCGERLYASDGRSLFISELGMPESMPAENVLGIFPDDGQEIRGIECDENRVYVGRSESLIYLTGGVSALERHVLDDAHGVASHGSMQLVNGKLFWFTGEDFMVSDGGPGRSITTGQAGDGSRLRLYMESLDQEDQRKTVAAIWPEASLYIFLGRWNQNPKKQNDNDRHPHSILDSDMLAYNYETGAWWPLRFAPQSAHIPLVQPSMALVTAPGPDGEFQLLSSHTNGVQTLFEPGYLQDDLVSGSGPFTRTVNPIEWKLGLPEIGGTHGFKYGLRNVTISQDRGISEITYGVTFGTGTYQYIPGAQSLAAVVYGDKLYAFADRLKDRTISMVQGPIFTMNLNTIRTPKRLVYVELFFGASNFFGATVGTAPPMLYSVELDVRQIRRTARRV